MFINCFTEVCSDLFVFHIRFKYDPNNGMTERMIIIKTFNSNYFNDRKNINYKNMANLLHGN